VNGKPLVEKRGEGTLTLLPNAHVTLDVDLGGLLASVPGVESGFKLGYAKGYLESEEKGVRVMAVAEKGLDFMKMPVEDLTKYHVLMSTNRGDMELEFWPDVAPNHVRKLPRPLLHGLLRREDLPPRDPGLHDPGRRSDGHGLGQRPRECSRRSSNSRKHEPGVLSMARSASPDSASCQFFVMHKTSPSLDGQYSAFGKLVSGLDVVDKIVNSPRNGQDRPNQTQSIVKATVIKALGQVVRGRLEEIVAMGFENILLERNGAVAWVTLNRPKVLNALNGATLRELAAAFDEVEADASVRCLVVTVPARRPSSARRRHQRAREDAAAPGEGSRLLRPAGLRAPREDDEALGRDDQRLCLGWRCELALACTLRTASTTAKLGLPRFPSGSSRATAARSASRGSPGPASRASGS